MKEYPYWWETVPPARRPVAQSSKESVRGRVDLAVADLVWRGLTLRSGLLGTREDLEEGVTLLFAGKVKPSVELVSLDEVPERLWALRDLGFPGRLVVLP